MKRSDLSKTVGGGIITFSLAMLPLVPVSAQTNTTTPGSSTPGASPAPIDATTGNSPAPSPAPSEPTAGTSPAPSPAPSEPTAGTSPAPSEPTAGASPNQENTSTTGESHSSWGWLGLLGLLGLASLFHKPARRSAVGLTSNKQLQTIAHSADDRFEQGFAQAQVEARNFWGELKADVTDFKERRAKAKEIKRIKGALGRSVNRVILDKQDNVILNVGDLITHQAIEHARHADTLDILLDSVDDRVPEIANEERRAPVVGEASLEEQKQDTTTV